MRIRATPLPSVKAAMVMAVLAAQALFAQTLKPTTPGSSGDPAWQGVLHLTDGRTFVTDGGLAIDVAVAKPSTVPTRELAAKVLEGYLNASHRDEFGMADLTAAATGRTYTTPKGMPLNA